MKLTTSTGETFDVYLAGSETANKAILILHDWWGLLDYNKAWAEHFAQHGYQSLVIDLYEGHHPNDSKAAGEYMRNLDQIVLDRKIAKALTYLQKPQRKIAILGWSFGGLQAQYAALNHSDSVDAIALYYCRIILTQQNVEKLNNCAVLGIFSETERTWPDKQVTLETILGETNNKFKCYSYEADHGFANPDSPRYDEDVTEEALQVTLQFLDLIL